MSEYIGSRISLISKSDVRYVGILNEINSEQSTVSLENVKSYGTEGRRSRPEEIIPPSDQVYEYIIFRGSDVKDLRIEQQPVKETKPAAVPSDPAILGARPREAPQAQPQEANNQRPNVPGPAGGAPGFPQPGPPPFNNYYGPPPGSWGRGGGPGPAPGPGFGNMPYPPPPGWFPPAQGFPPGPGGPGPGPWNANYPFPPGVPGPAGPPAQVQAQAQAQGQAQAQKSRRTPVGTPGTEGKPAAAPGKQDQPPQASQQPPTEPKSLGQGAPKAPTAPTPSQDAKAPKPAIQKAQPESIPTGPKNNRVAPVIPAVPKPFQVPASMAGAAASSSKSTAPASNANVQDATEAAKAAVALAMAKMEAGNIHVPQQQSSGAMDNLTKKVNEMRVHAVRAGHTGRGRGRGGRSGPSKIEVPDADFDFASANAKFNKDDIVKEAIAGSPSEAPNGSGAEVVDTESAEKPASPQAYDKKKSFFDNISSEAKDRAEGSGQKAGGREWRGEEQRKNIETFGQGSVDGGFRNNYRGRGRGRGGRGRGYQGGYQGRGGGRGGNFRPRDGVTSTPSAPQ
ncbi:hypothetical protein SAPIO_CDS6038 [Scedosporium apiospermum]|uniref:G2 m phase checkpoint control protein n=1 Tax=Pseudallescheria apiosperma TaxID=563466 RepID=A0A084G5Z0_PSEDA|nr:uncharacterized protein SAPIO_CDS6038 [Scedosporium apiospermum]KEZ42752.1 hypothetical protein SAPIO_CDS6038 [Scedosporium apiospermum]